MGRPCLHVCITCRAGQEASDDVPRPGALLRDALAALGADAVELREVACLAACERGCNAAISMPGKWTYFLCGLHAGIAGDVLAYAGAYAASTTGSVMPSKRPESLRGAILGRVPGVPS
jgi:predicted metal-binding protein